MQNLCFVQNSTELRFVLEQKINSKNITFIPLNLGSLVDCVENKLKFVNLNMILKDKSKKLSILSEKIMKKLDKSIFRIKTYEGLKVEISKQIQYEVNATLLIKEILNAYSKKKFDLILSGWNGYHDKNLDYKVSRIVSIINDNKRKINFLSKVKYKKQKTESYNLCNKNLDGKKFVLLSNLGYNFTRILKYFYKRKIKSIMFIKKDEFNFLKELFFKSLGVKFIKFTTKEKKSLNLQPFKINYYNLDKGMSKILKIRFKDLETYLDRSSEKCKMIEGFLNKNYNKIHLVLTNFCEGFSGFLLESAERKKLNSLNISHGTISDYYKSKTQRHYQKSIARSVFLSKYSYNAIQSKISYRANRHLYKLNKNTISKNIIFSEVKKKEIKKYIIFAVTNKDFDNIRFLGVEMFYEYFETLEILNRLANKYKFNIIVKAHPQILSSYEKLKKIFPKLIFSKNKIDNELKKSFACISYSSSAIEDALNSHVPVILFDRWRRYKHLQIIKTKKNNAIEYVNNFNDLLKKVNKIRSQKDFNFEDYIYTDDSSKNIENLMKRFF